MAENRNRGNTWVTGAGHGLLTVNSVLAIYRARGDPASILFVSVSYAALLLLFACLRAYERAPPGPGSPAGERARRARAVWPLPTLLTMAFAWKVAAVMPSSAAPAAVVWGLGVMTCDTALAVHDALGDPCSATTLALVGVAYAAYLALTFRFIRAFAGRASH
ncbi:unnamed protein product [Urochloa humidicola]